MGYDYTEYESMHGHSYAPSSGFPEANLDEPPDDDMVYYDTWLEVEARVAEMKRNAERSNGVVATEFEPELVSK